MKIAVISEHASPLAALDGADVGGQNVHVAELSAALAERGHAVDVYTRRDNPELPERMRTEQGYTVVHVPVGPPRQVPKDELLQYMVAFGRYLGAQWDRERPDIAHAHFWMSGIAAQLAAKRRRVPTVQTFHALGVVKQRHQGHRDSSPAERLRLEVRVAQEATWVTAGCSDEAFELIRLGRDRLRISVVPCGVDVERFAPHGPIAERSGRRRIVAVGRPAPRKGLDTVIEALTTGAQRRAGDRRRTATGQTRHGSGGLSAAKSLLPISLWRSGYRYTVPSPVTIYPRCCGRWTSLHVHPGTGPSASCRWKRWPAGFQWWRWQWAACSTLSCTT